MLKIEKFVTPSPEQWDIVIEGMRNPKNSWDRMDSYYSEDCYGNCHDCDSYDYREGCPIDRYVLGPNDRKLAMQLADNGPVHAKYRRMLGVLITISAPQFWWSEFDTYKVGTARNSCSKMHKIHVAPFTIDNFSHEGCDSVLPAGIALRNLIDVLEELRQKFNETQNRNYWRALIELLPSGYNMKATVNVNYEVLANMYTWRKYHKLNEWRTFCNWIEELPYSELITGDLSEVE